MTIVAFAISLVLGVIAAVCRTSGSRTLRLLSGIYVEVTRNTPVLLQIFIVFFGLPALGMKLSAITAGIIAIGVNVGAYLSEAFRAGLASVPRGQTEAAAILGLSRAKTFWHVVAPQALRNVYPATVNNLIQVLLGTSLLTAIAVPELTGVATVINAKTLLFVQVFAIAIVIYLVLSYGLSLGADLLARVLFKEAKVYSRPNIIRAMFSRIRVARFGRAQ